MQDASIATPTRYGILITVMRDYHWSWSDICSAPADLIQEIVIRLEAEYHWREERRKQDEDRREQQRGRR